MSDSKMLINYVPGEECRVAVVSEDRLEELHHERANATSLVGNIYVGKVMNVEPAIQAAFVDFGIGNNGFLHVSDVHPQYFPGEDEETTERIGKKTPRRERPPIQHCLKRGQEVLVQVLKEGISTKGPTLTSYLSIPGRYLVMLPQMDKSGVSKKVEDEEARKEMKAVLDQLELPEGFGFIVRTAGIGRNKTDLKRDLAYLQRLWTDIEKRRSSGSGPRLLYAESDLLMRALRDIWNTEIAEIVIDNEAAIKRAARFMKIVSPRGTTKLLHYNLGAPMFHAFGIEEQIERIHAREVPLPSGGYLVIDEAEALVAIDVNSGKSRESRDAETNAFRTNQEAVDEICRQLKLRDVGGLVLCDLIDMSNRKHRKDIEAQFKERLKRDRAATRTLPVSEFGIVEMTRQRMKGSFQSHHFAGCPACQGRGKLRKPDSVAGDAMRELQALLDRPQVAKVEMVVSPRMGGELLSTKRQAISRLEFHSKKHVDVRISDAVAVDRVSFYAYDGSGADIELEKLNKPKVPRDLPEWKYAVATRDENESDWAVDTAREPSELPPELMQEPKVEELDLISDDNEGDEQGWVTARQDDQQQGSGAGEEGGKRRRRRRRRGRGRGGEGDDQAGGRQPGSQGGAPTRAPALGQAGETVKAAPPGGFGSWDVAPGEPVPTQRFESNESGVPDDAGAHPHQQGDQGEPGEGGRRKRRRRRRRGRGGSPDAMNGGPATRDGETPIFDGADQPGTNDDSPSRGDSWDQPAPQRPAAPQPTRQGARAPQPPKPRMQMVARKRVKLDEFFRPVLDENGEPVYEEIMEAVPVTEEPGAPVSVDAADTAPLPMDVPSAGEASPIRNAEASDADLDSDDESDQEPEGGSGGPGPDQQQGEAPRKKRRRRGRRGKGGGGQPNAGPAGAGNQGPDRQNRQPREQRNEPRREVEAKSSSQQAPAASPAPKAGSDGAKPFRPLYGAGRAKVSPSKAAVASRSSRE